MTRVEEAQLDGLPTFAAFRRSAVVTATSAVTQKLPAALAPALTFTAAPAAVTRVVQSTSSNEQPVLEAWPVPGDKGSNAAHGQSEGLEAGPGSSAARIRPLPTQFQPRSLGHASLLVQHSGVRARLQDRALHSGIYCEPAAGGGPTAASPSGSALGGKWGGAAGDAFSVLQNGTASLSSPPHAAAIKGGSMSLAAHAAVAMRGKRGV